MLEQLRRLIQILILVLAEGAVYSSKVPPVVHGYSNEQKEQAKKKPQGVSRPSCSIG